MDLLISLFFICLVVALLALPLLVGASVRHLVSRGRTPPPEVDFPPAKTAHESWLVYIRARKAERLRIREKIDREIDAAVARRLREP